MEIRNAVIESADLYFQTFGALTAVIHLDYGDGWKQGFGGYMMFHPHHAETSIDISGRFISRVLQVADVIDWNDLPGKTVRAQAEHTTVHAIGHIVGDDWFVPAHELSQQI